MSRSYDEFMEKIEVSDDMKKRILNNINSNDFSKSKKIILLSKYKKISTIAACIAVIIAISVFLPSLLKPDMPNPNVDFGITPYNDYKDLESLEKDVGYSVSKIHFLPYTCTKTTCYRYNDFTEIEYAGEDNSIFLRQGKADYDISGDYNEYEDIRELKINSFDVTLRGNNNIYTSAIWFSNDFSFSVYANNPISIDDFTKIISSIE